MARAGRQILRHYCGILGQLLTHPFPPPIILPTEDSAGCGRPARAPAIRWGRTKKAGNKSEYQVSRKCRTSPPLSRITQKRRQHKTSWRDTKLSTVRREYARPLHWSHWSTHLLRLKKNVQKKENPRALVAVNAVPLETCVPHTTVVVVARLLIPKQP